MGSRLRRHLRWWIANTRGYYRDPHPALGPGGFSRGEKGGGRGLERDGAHWQV